ncbi:efflux RND transporter periplasmic adaptor subunit [bacterium]|nr:efflux RND transporter periplasmic adaptor subunit [bacterium]
MWRKIGGVVLVLAVVGLIAGIVWKQSQGGKDGKKGGFSFSFGKKKKQDEKQEPLYEAARVGDLLLTVEATGETEPVTDIEVKSEATGRIVEFYVEEGSTLAAGDVICKLDQSNQQIVVDQARISVQQAELNLRQAKEASSVTSRANLEEALKRAETGVSDAQQGLDDAQATLARISELHIKGFATDQELQDSKARLSSAEAVLANAQTSLENAKTQLENFSSTSNKLSIKEAQLRLDQARVSLKDAERQLGKSTITSPIDGIVLEKLLDVGDSVQSINSAFSAGTTVIKVADLRKIQVRTNVDEIDIGKVKRGLKATVVVDTFPDKTFTGTVTNVFPQGVQSGQGLITFPILVEVDNSENLLLGKMTATVKIEAQKLEKQLLIPLAATRAGKNKDETIVYVLKEGGDKFDKKAESEERVVKIGDTDYKDVIIVEGLKDGELVKVRGFETGISFD